MKQQRVCPSGHSVSLSLNSRRTMIDLWVSLSVLVAAVLLSEATRRITSRLFARASWLYLLEAASTFQLCCCSQELKLLAEKANLKPQPLIALTLTYTITVVHLTTFRGAACNPVGVLDRVYRGIISGRAAVVLIACQFAAALASQFFAASVWSLGLSDVHVRQQKFGTRCFDPVGGTLLEAAAAELVGAFIMQAVVLNLHKVDAKLRVFCIATLITTLSYAGL